MGFNIYSDQRIPTASGHGIDIASQRADDLDRECIKQIESLIGLNPSISALDIGCGSGGQAKRMAGAGATVMALDIDDYSSCFSETNIGFHMADMREIEALFCLQSFDIAICQRSVHYLSYKEALQALSGIRQVLKPGASFFLSASGINSELGKDYPGKGRPIQERFCPLAPDMAKKHGISRAVCLYSEAELSGLLVETGFVVDKVFSSPFGNIKAVSHITVEGA